MAVAPDASEQAELLNEASKTFVGKKRFLAAIEAYTEVKLSFSSFPFPFVSIRRHSFFSFLLFRWGGGGITCPLSFDVICSV